MKNKIDKKVLFSIMIVIIISLLTNVVAETLINSKDVSYVDNSNLKATNVQAAIDGTCTKFSNDLTDLKTNLKKEILNQAYPINSVYISYSNTNPGTLFGGTWEIIGDGRVLKGIKSGTAGTTGGSSTVTLSMSNIPAHTHDISHTHTTIEKNTTTMSLTAQTAGAHSHSLTSDKGTIYSQWNGAGTKYFVFGGLQTSDIVSVGLQASSAGNHTHTVTGSVTIPTLSTGSISTTTSGSAGSSNPTAINVQDPYITVYMWRRTK